MQDIEKKLANVKEQIEAKINHPYLLRFIKNPVIDEDKLLILLSILDGQNLSKDRIENYALTTMLLHLALDTHDQVTNSKADFELTNRQLTVLAGTYYSGLYYKILSNMDDIQAVRLLAEGVKTINDHKLIVYEKDIDSLDRLMKSIDLIETSFFKNLTDHLQAEFWNDLVSNFLIIKRLLREKEQFIQSKSSIFFDALKKLVFPKCGDLLENLSIEQQNYLILVCDRYIDFTATLLSEGKGKVPFINNLLEERISMVLNQHHPIAKTLAEEG